VPEREVVSRARQDRRQGKAATTQAGEFVREEIHHIRAGKHGARSTKQAIAIGLAKARRAGVDLRPPAKGQVSERTRESARRAYTRGQQDPRRRATSARRSRASRRVLKRERRRAASPEALSRQAHAAAARRGPRARSAAAQRAARTKGPAGRSAASRKAARTRARLEAGEAS
jgi:hypothetical protein